MAEELRDYKITDEEYKNILRARERLAEKQRKKAKETVQGFVFDFYGFDYNTSTYMIQAEKIQAVPENDIYTKENRWRRVSANNEFGGTYMPLDLWKNADKETKDRYYGRGLFVPETELTDETLQYILEEFKTFKNIVIPQSIERDQNDIVYFQKRMNDVKKLIKTKRKQLNDKPTDSIIRYIDRNSRSVYANPEIICKMKYKKFLKVIDIGGK